MGRPNAEPLPDQTSIIHFSHPHQLYLSNIQTSSQNFPCSACKLEATGSVYTCKPCNFILHPNCYQLPHQIRHPFDQNHALLLQAKPVYPEGLFNCDACGNPGAGFSYHCGPCGVDLHTTCATLPAQFTHKCHHHQLSLVYAAPYPGNAFSCDVCKWAGSKTWIYRCNICEFDVHLTCVSKVIPGPARIQQPQQAPQIGLARSVVYPPQPLNFVNQPNNGAYGAPRPQVEVMGQPQNQFGANPYPYNNLNQPVYGAGVRPVNGVGLTDQLAVAAANGLASGVAQATTEAVLQGFFGGGGGGGGNGVGFVDIMGMGGGGSYLDGGYGGTDGGYSGGDGSS